MKLSLELVLAIVLSCLTIAAAAADPAAATYFPEGNSDVYVDWLQGASYSRSAFLPSNTVEGNGVALHWTIDDDTIHIAVAGMAKGWIGFGLGESGSMKGADIVMFTAANGGNLVDSYVLDMPGMPAEDDCQSWVLHNSTVKENFIIFEASRLLDTGDNQDRAFMNDSNLAVLATRVLAAWGDSALPSYHGPDNNARSSVRFFGQSSVQEFEVFAKQMQAEAEGNFVMKANNFLIPSIEETTYGYFCFNVSALGVPVDQDLHTIGIEEVIDPRSKEYVHHFIVIGSTEGWDASLDCEGEFTGTELSYAWAPGDLPMVLPQNVGGPLGVSGFKSFQIQTHYHNPKLTANVTDSSGIRYYYTSKKRPYDLGVFQTGDPNVGLFGQRVAGLSTTANGNSNGLAQHVFVCDGACSQAVVQEPLTVFREQLHVHRGVSVSNQQLRLGQVVHTSKCEYWDFDQQGAFSVPLEETYQILPGDAFRTTCTFQNEVAKDKVWGIGSSDEMCISFLYYFPRQSVFVCGVGIGEYIPECEADHTVTTLDSLTNSSSADLQLLERSFGSPSSECKIDDNDTSSFSFMVASSHFVVMTTLFFALLAVV